MNKMELGIIGLGVMGRGLALNFSSKDTGISLYNRELTGIEENVAANFVKEFPARTLAGFNNIQQFIQSLQTPRMILIMVSAKDAVDTVITEIRPYLDKGDIIIDGGNSHFKDTEKRVVLFETEGIRYLGAGISGGEYGARTGCSIMAGGSREAYDRVEPHLNTIAAKDRNDKPCCHFFGPGGAGHFVKMIHNGIEYAEMQLIAELYFFLKHHYEKDNLEIADIFESWLKLDTDNYLLSITVDILKRQKGKGCLVDKILDIADQKGTGSWVCEVAMNAGLPSNTVTSAVIERYISLLKDERVRAQAKYKHGFQQPRVVDRLNHETMLSAYNAARIINHAINFELLRNISCQNDWKLELAEVARVWTSGSIIRSGLMENLIEILRETPDSNFLLSDTIASRLIPSIKDLSELVAAGVKGGCSMPVFSAAINYYYSYTSGLMPANLIQAQRDYFGTHGYRRIDAPADQVFHTAWMECEPDQD